MINSSSKCFHLFFSGVQLSRPFRQNLHLNRRKALILFLHPSFYLIILLSPEFFMVVLHDSIHSSRVHQNFVGGVNYPFFSHLEVQLILRILVKWSFAFLRSSQLSNHFRL